MTTDEVGAIITFILQMGRLSLRAEKHFLQGNKM